MTCRLLGFSEPAISEWLANPVSRRDWDDAHLITAALDIHRDDPAFGHRFIADELREQGIPQVSAGCAAVLAAADLVGERPRSRA